MVTVSIIITIKLNARDFVSNIGKLKFMNRKLINFYDVRENVPANRIK